METPKIPKARPSASFGRMDGDSVLSGSATIVETDKAFVGGYDKKGADDRRVVLGMVERRGNVIARHPPGKSGCSSSGIGLLLRKRQHQRPDPRMELQSLPQLGFKGVYRPENGFSQIAAHCRA